ncbi:MAG: hypothetical protein QOI35_2289, partial [Cryptosporangiaceae bacterium]|nr:hypothetical protein [Cryptosporangiaceae bacterium]
MAPAHPAARSAASNAATTSPWVLVVGLATTAVIGAPAIRAASRTDARQPRGERGRRWSAQVHWVRSVA